MESVNSHATCLARVIIQHLERKHFPSIAARLTHQAFEVRKKAAREVGPFTAWRDRNFHVDTAWTAIFRGLSNQQAKRGAFIHRQPQSVIQAPLGFNLTNVDLLVLQRACENREMAAIEKMGKADGLRAEVRMNAYQLAVERAGK